MHALIFVPVGVVHTWVCGICVCVCVSLRRGVYVIRFAFMCAGRYADGSCKKFPEGCAFVIVCGQFTLGITYLAFSWWCPDGVFNAVLMDSDGIVSFWRSCFGGACGVGVVVVF